MPTRPASLKPNVGSMPHNHVTERGRTGSRMTRLALEKYAAVMRRRYKPASKAGKSRILDEFCQTTGFIGKQPYGCSTGTRSTDWSAEAGQHATGWRFWRHWCKSGGSATASAATSEAGHLLYLYEGVACLKEDVADRIILGPSRPMLSLVAMPFLGLPEPEQLCVLSPRCRDASTRRVAGTRKAGENPTPHSQSPSSPNHQEADAILDAAVQRMLGADLTCLREVKHGGVNTPGQAQLRPEHRCPQCGGQLRRPGRPRPGCQRRQSTAVSTWKSRRRSRFFAHG
jgi:hypothetical protein